LITPPSSPSHNSNPSPTQPPNPTNKKNLDRIAGYLALILLLATVALAAETDYSKSVLKLRLWAVLAAEALIVAGVFPRVHLRKLGVGVRVPTAPVTVPPVEGAGVGEGRG
jgi:hypothetical protein